MLMPPIDAMVIFAHVVEAQAFTGAAEALGLSKSAVSKAVAGLERHLGVRLLHRTTRKLRLTEAGERFHPHCARIVAEAEQAELAVGRLDGRPRGKLRVTAPIALGRSYVLPVLLELIDQHPDLEIDLRLDDAYVDLVGSGIDVAVRVGRLVDSSLVARKLAPVRAFLVASAEHLARYGTPASPEDLAAHPFLHYTLGHRPDQLVLERGDERVTVRTRSRLHMNNGDAILEAVLAGAGVGVMPDFIGTDAFCDGRLQVVLPEWHLQGSAIYAVYPQGGPVTPAVRQLVDALASKAEALVAASGDRPFAIALYEMGLSSARSRA